MYIYIYIYIYTCIQIEDFVKTWSLGETGAYKQMSFDCNDTIFNCTEFLTTVCTTNTAEGFVEKWSLGLL